MNSAGSGAAIFCMEESNPRITACEMVANNSVGLGGAIGVEASAIVEVSHCDIRNNVGGDGGGICVSAASAVITDCCVENNIADFGGGLSFLSALDVDIASTNIDGNRSVFFGGGVHASSSTFSLTGCRIAANLSDGEGGAIDLYESEGTIRSSQISDNSSQGQIGGVHVFASALEVSGSEIVDNGVGICVDGAPSRAVDARYNWWGDETGPYHPVENPGGLGDAVSDHVDFVPWNVVSAVIYRGTILASLRSAPNPFREATTVRFPLPTRTDIRLQVYDAAGRLVTTLFDGPCGPGVQEITWNGSDARLRGLAGGIYFLRLRTDGAVRSCRVSLLR